MTASFRFPRTARVRARSEFDRIFKHGRRVALPVLALHWLAESAAPATASDAAVPPLTAADGSASDASSPSRADSVFGADAGTGATAPSQPEPPETGASFGLAVSRKVDKRAVGRNRIKRVLRDFFRHHRAELAPGAYVAVARPGAAALDNAQLTSTLHALLRRAGALPASGTTGTMPAAACEPHRAPPQH